MVRIELNNGEEVIEKNVSKFGRIDGLKRWEGRRAKIIFLSEKREK